MTILSVLCSDKDVVFVHYNYIYIHVYIPYSQKFDGDFNLTVWQSRR